MMMKKKVVVVEEEEEEKEKRRISEFDFIYTYKKIACIVYHMGGLCDTIWRSIDKSEMIMVREVSALVYFKAQSSTIPVNNTHSIILKTTYFMH